MNNDTNDRTLERMIRENGTQLFRLCFLYLGDMSLAEDALQDSFVSAYRHLNTFRGDCAERTWLTRIAINTCRTYRRSAWARRVELREALDGVAPPTCELEPYDDTVTKCVMALPPKYKEVVLLRYYRQMRVREIARVLDASENTVSTRLKRAQEKLRKALKGWYFDE